MAVNTGLRHCAACEHGKDYDHVLKYYSPDVTTSQHQLPSRSTAQKYIVLRTNGFKRRVLELQKRYQNLHYSFPILLTHFLIKSIHTKNELQVQFLSELSS